MELRTASPRKHVQGRLLNLCAQCGETIFLPEAALHWSGPVIWLALWWFAHDRLRGAAWSIAAAALPVIALATSLLSDSPRLHHTIAVGAAAVWVAGLAALRIGDDAAATAAIDTAARRGWTRSAEPA